MKALKAKDKAQQLQAQHVPYQQQKPQQQVMQEPSELKYMVREDIEVARLRILKILVEHTEFLIDSVDRSGRITECVSKEGIDVSVLDPLLDEVGSSEFQKALELYW